jgi:hypothetical protein
MIFRKSPPRLPLHSHSTRCSSSCANPVTSASLFAALFLAAMSCKNKISSGAVVPAPNQDAPLQPAQPTPMPPYETLGSPAAPVVLATSSPGDALLQMSSKERALARYDASLGQRLAQSAQKNMLGQTSQGLCYLSVGRALEFIWPRGFHDDGGCGTLDLNCRDYARSFAEHWKSSVHGIKIPLEAVFLKGNKNGEAKATGFNERDAPVGSVLVWKSCSSNPAGHIAIITQKGKKAVSDFPHGVDLCPSNELIGIFMPVRK